MKRRRSALCLASLILVCFSCSSGSGGDGTNFNAFVRDQLDATADDTEPVAVDGLDFRFSEDPDAFDDLF